jgi:hypothetical protein
MATKSTRRVSGAPVTPSATPAKHSSPNRRGIQVPGHVPGLQIDLEGCRERQRCAAGRPRLLLGEPYAHRKAFVEAN